MSMTSGRVRSLLSDMINRRPSTREQLEELYGKVWTDAEMRDQFRTILSNDPLIVPRRRSDGRFCSMMIQRDPLFYFSPRYFDVPDLPDSELRVAVELAVLQDCVEGTCDCVTVDEHRAHLEKAKVWGIAKGGLIR